MCCATTHTRWHIAIPLFWMTTMTMTMTTTMTIIMRTQQTQTTRSDNYSQLPPVPVLVVFILLPVLTVVLLKVLLVLPLRKEKRRKHMVFKLVAATNEMDLIFLQQSQQRLIKQNGGRRRNIRTLTC